MQNCIQTGTSKIIFIIYNGCRMNSNAMNECVNLDSIMNGELINITSI